MQRIPLHEVFGNDLVMPLWHAETMVADTSTTEPNEGVASMHPEAVFLTALVHIDGLGPHRITHLCSQFGSAEAAWHAPASELRQAGLPWSLIANLQQSRTQHDPWHAAETMHAAGIDILTPHDEHYPGSLHHIPLAPPVLFVRGQRAALAGPCVAMVGTRHPSTYGIDVTTRLAGDLAMRGITVVSGLALGIDAVAHQAALRHSGGTVAVLPSGVDLIYPERNRALAEQILAHPQGALVSEFYPGTRATTALFPARNRLISGLALGSVVCEAGEQSGALITAKAALEQGREVMVVPGSIFSPQSAGCLALLRQGATPVRHCDDICEAIGYQMPYQASTTLDPLLRLLQTPRHIDELCRLTQRSSADLLGDLLMRELRGEVCDQGHGFFVRAS